jgi:fructosamine-3-kinase
LSNERSRPAWTEELQAALGTPELRSWTPIAGGDIGESHRVELASGDRIFVKRYDDGLPGIASSEARGLKWLYKAGALRVPEILATGENWLALEWIESAPRARDFDERLGAGLARLHATGADRFGLDHDNWIGRLPQCNEPHDDWSHFYGECRLRPLLRLATRDGTLPATLGRRLDLLIEGLAERVGPSEPPARLHGDLWSGNLIADETGSPCLIDPAVYGGHREMDLAMMKLFGGFDRRSFEAYDEAHPLAQAFETRVPLYQVYPLLVHVFLFGRGYLDGLSRAIEQSLSIPC